MKITYCDKCGKDLTDHKISNAMVILNVKHPRGLLGGEDSRHETV